MSTENDEPEFDGSRILEKLAEINMLEDFYDAVDSDNFTKAAELLRQATIDKETIAIVLRTMREANGDQ